MLENTWRQYRRNLPHLRLRGATYFVTWRLHPSLQELSEPQRSAVVDTLRHFDRQRYALHAFVVMNDHVHALVTPDETHRLDEILQSWKSFSAHVLTARFGRVAPVRLDESFDRIVRDESELQEKAQYIINNPFKRWPELREYPWMGIGAE